MSDDDYEPRPDDFLVEPMFAPFEPGAEPGEGELEEQAEPRGWWSAFLRLLGRE